MAIFFFNKIDFLNFFDNFLKKIFKIEKVEKFVLNYFFNN